MNVLGSECREPVARPLLPHLVGSPERRRVVDDRPAAETGPGEDPDCLVVRRRGGVAEVAPVALELSAVEIRIVVVRPCLEHDHVQARAGQDGCGRPSARARSDDADVAVELEIAGSPRAVRSPSAEARRPGRSARGSRCGPRSGSAPRSEQAARTRGRAPPCAGRGTPLGASPTCCCTRRAGSARGAPATVGRSAARRRGSVALGAGGARPAAAPTRRARGTHQPRRARPCPDGRCRKSRQAPAAGAGSTRPARREPQPQPHHELTSVCQPLDAFFATSPMISASSCGRDHIGQWLVGRSIQVTLRSSGRPASHA